MSTAIEKTKNLKRKFVKINMLEANPDNPNEMTDAEFNMLYDNIGLVGLTDPIFCVPHPTKKKMYRIIGGEHRWEVAKLYNFEEVPITLVDDESFTQDQQKFQIVRHNIIHGSMSTKKFMDLYEGLSTQYTNEVAAEMFGFSEKEDFERLIKQTKTSLPKELQDSFDAAKGDLKTIDDLSLLLNRLFSQHGDNLPYGYMIFEFGGKDSVWLRMGTSDLNNFNVLAEICKENSVTLDGVVSELLQLIAKGGDDV
ncbi:MAG: ParB N-terminal domain-containing protein, partial [Chlamydiia bacterium]|nr:ParB N-terminal domain-containing protein [Chlamydiia bacterium]